MLKAFDSVLNLVNPPLSNMALLRGQLDNVVIGSECAKIGTFYPGHGHIVELPVGQCLDGPIRADLLRSKSVDIR